VWLVALKMSRLVFFLFGDKMRAAVYTGTRNLYESMIGAAKSLLTFSDVD
jgi:hypothetical protein